ncbi:hypothetical protein J8J14_08390 [Roseomonas sp. SSH11]|uniref:Uncharacterized protein n=1 Tax=Pararoseomonas baculiformis TaxID=2820812 RepID=A0ABS4ACQ5_9PROT|nr:hypothetical protein [Pararoseomonas baculiformis]MBP0444802.1 hypothetical protein [Pararoseomonas baculiformis]
MSNPMMSKTLRTLGLAAALIGATAAPSLAEGFYVAGPTALPAWTQQADSRTPLAGRSTAPNAAQTFLERSGATGNGGQHS